MGDILTVPFAPEELLARVIARMRRSYSDAVTFTPVIKIGELEIDILKRTVLTGALELHLTPLEQSLLYLLAANAGRVVSRDEILDTLWGVDSTAELYIATTCGRYGSAHLKKPGKPEVSLYAPVVNRAPHVTPLIRAIAWSRLTCVLWRTCWHHPRRLSPTNNR